METLVIAGAIAIGYTIGKIQNNPSYYSKQQQKSNPNEKRQKKIRKRRSNTPPRKYKKSLELRAPSRT
jgi:hypothetical protein